VAQDASPPPSRVPLAPESLLAEADINGVQLGMTRADVLAALGTPTSDGGVDWLYYAPNNASMGVVFEPGRQVVREIDGPSLRRHGQTLIVRGEALDQVKLELGEPQRMVFGPSGIQWAYVTSRGYAVIKTDNHEVGMIALVRRTTW
jgi:hypothetical protein